MKGERKYFGRDKARAICVCARYCIHKYIKTRFKPVSWPTRLEIWRKRSCLDGLFSSSTGSPRSSSICGVRVRRVFVLPNPKKVDTQAHDLV